MIADIKATDFEHLKAAPRSHPETAKPDRRFGIPVKEKGPAQYVLRGMRAPTLGEWLAGKN
jgi:hypothetical protein